METAHVFAIGVLLAWLAGIRAYLTVFGVGIAGLLGWLVLPPALQVAQSPWVLGVSGALAAGEFFADKLPGVDSVWDLLQTLLRIPAGAFLAAATLSPDGTLGTGMLVTGAGVALASHALKAGTRGVVNVSPEPVSNWVASLSEDALVVGALLLALHHPWLALAVAIAVSLGLALLAWWVGRHVLRSMARLGGRAPSPGSGRP